MENKIKYILENKQAEEIMKNQMSKGLSFSSAVNTAYEFFHNKTFLDMQEICKKYGYELEDAYRVEDNVEIQINKPIGDKYMPDIYYLSSKGFVIDSMYILDNFEIHKVKINNACEMIIELSKLDFDKLELRKE